MKNTPDNKDGNKSETDSITEKFDELRDVILDRIAAGEEPRNIAESHKLPHFKLSEWIMRQDNYKSLFAVHRANLIHKQMVIEQVQSGAIATLAQIACNSEEAGSFDSTSDSRRMETVRKACVDILKFDTHAFEPPKRRQTAVTDRKYRGRDDDNNNNGGFSSGGFGGGGSGSNSGGDPENPLDSIEVIADPNPADGPPSGDSVLFALDWLNKPLDSADREEFDKFVDDYTEEWKGNEKSWRVENTEHRSEDGRIAFNIRCWMLEVQSSNSKHHAHKKRSSKLTRSSILTSRPLFFKQRYSHTSLRQAASDRRVVEERSPPQVV